MQDELLVFATLAPVSCNPGHSHTMGPAASHWHSRKPLICNVSNSYAAWVIYTKRHSKSAHASTWGKHYEWLLKPTTYIRLKGLADVLEIYDRMGLIANQYKGPFKDGATDVGMKKRELCAELESYILSAPPQEGE